MEVHLPSETESRLRVLANQSGRGIDDLIEDAMAAYLNEIAQIRETLDARYDDIKSGRVQPTNGEVFFDRLRQKEDELRRKSTCR